MIQSIDEIHYTDPDGNPAGGSTHSTGLDITWQNGLVENQEPNGAFAETVIRAALGRLQYYNDGKFRCRENSLAITHLEEAIHWLKARQEARETRAVANTHTT